MSCGDALLPLYADRFRGKCACVSDRSPDCEDGRPWKSARERIYDAIQRVPTL